MRYLVAIVLVAATGQAREPLRDIGLLAQIIDAYTRSVDVDDPQVLAGAYPGRTLSDFDRNVDGAFGAATDDAVDDTTLAVLQFNHDDLDADGDGLLGLVELDCVVGETRLDPASAQTFPGVDDGELDCDGDGLGNAAELARGLDPLDGRDARACADDAHEPNDVDATPLEVDFEGPATLCLDDLDRYAFDVPAGTAALVVSVGFSHADGNLDVRLTDPDGAVSDGDSVDDDERFEVADPAAGSWNLEVFGARNDYTLRVTAVPALGCVPDPREPGAGDDTPERGRFLDLGANDVEVVEGQRVCPGDSDWFAIDLGEGDGTTIRLEMLGNPADANSELELFIHGPGLPAPGGPEPLLPNNAGGDGSAEAPFYLEFRAARDNPTISAGRYYLEMVGIDIEPAQWGDYRLRVAVERLRRLCLQDRFEGNEDAENATDITGIAGFGRADGELIPGVGRQIDDLTLCSRDEDWFEVDLDAGDDLTVSLTREAPIEGDVRVEIRDAQGRNVANDRNADALVEAELLEATAGRHTIRVDGLSDTQAFYSLRFNRTAAPVPCEPDADEANDDRALPTDIQPGLRGGRTLCAADGDVDWYRFEVAELSTVTAHLDFAHADADLELDVFRGDSLVSLNSQARQGHTRSDNETVTLRNQPAETYLLRVTGFSRGGASGNAPYALTLDVAPREFVCRDDPDEPNGSLEGATLLGFEPQVRETQWLCVRVPEEDDFFQIDIPPNTARVVGADFVLFDDGDLFLEAYDLDGMLRASTANYVRNQSKQCVVFAPSAEPRTFVVRVAPFSINTVLADDERLDYTLHLLDGEDCEAFGPPSPGIHWPRVR